MKIKEIMTRDPACCSPESRLSDVARQMADRDCGEIPVVDSLSSMKPVGVVTDRDMVIRAVARGRNPVTMSARDVMTSPPVTVRPDDPVDEACQVLEERQLRRVLVVDDTGRLCGIVSQADIAQHASERTTAEVVRVVSQPAV